jgi:hypothetical protein
MSTSRHGFDARDELLARLVDAERELWRRGGVDAQRRRREALREALDAGCSPGAVARVLEVSERDVVAWLPRPRPGDVSIR